jgi:hypothetical protein
VKNSDAVNIKLGLVVTEDVSMPTSNVLKTSNDNIKQAPRASVMNPLGTILYGNTAKVPEAKKLKLEIIYTKPK